MKPAWALRLRGGLWIVGGIWFVGVLVLFHGGCGSSGSDADPANPDDREAVARAFMAQLVEGTITDWHFNNPHSWLYIEAPDENGEMQQWGFEGAARVFDPGAGKAGIRCRPERA